MGCSARQLFLETRADGTSRIADHLGELLRRRRQQIESAGAGFQRGQLGYLGTARIEIAAHRIDDPDVAAAGQGGQRLEKADALRFGYAVRREQLLHLIHHEGHRASTKQWPQLWSPSRRAHRASFRRRRKELRQCWGTPIICKR